jgi:hypothetical protein
MTLDVIEEFRFDIYLSGPMTGIEDYNRPAFSELADNLRSYGFTVFNPAEVGDPKVIRSRSFYMRHDLKALLQSKQVYVLEGWSTSEGACLEVAIAKELGIPVIYSSHPSAKKRA